MWESEKVEGGRVAALDDLFRQAAQSKILASRARTSRQAQIIHLLLLIWFFSVDIRAVPECARTFAMDANWSVYQSEITHAAVEPEMEIVVEDILAALDMQVHDVKWLDTGLVLAGSSNGSASDLMTSESLIVFALDIFGRS
ncbi:hypothetical protein FVE85_6107 [Porphyridium purpureum]|uniref:Uncharacterized protein n=1 Tax=Porphyridium purpureum TaxID=35688 RepID=A0A5J4Z609_PORPP|nr:hypothetical protein FVE85_6107 [Porphyridium purpureum]|eukprot:POR5158..scf295_1